MVRGEGYEAFSMVYDTHASYTGLLWVEIGTRPTSYFEVTAVVLQRYTFRVRSYLQKSGVTFPDDDKCPLRISHQ